MTSNNKTNYSPNYVFTVCLKHTEMTVGQHPLMV